jgi:CRP-like cAMP-binding protein
MVTDARLSTAHSDSSSGVVPWAPADGLRGVPAATPGPEHHREDNLAASKADLSPWGNALLHALPAADIEVLRPHLERVALARDQPIFQPGEAAAHVWFPTQGVISIVALDDDGAAIEVAIVGREGMTGLPLVLGGDTMIYTAMVQVPGAGWRIAAPAFRAVVDRRPAIKAVMLRYVLAAMTQMGQNGACAQLHNVEARCARWLLLAHDDVEGDTFPLTQDYLAMMLGVTRPSISGAASGLQRAGLIRYLRGQITILDRAGLEACSCDCYGVVRREFERLLKI